MIGVAPAAAGHPPAPRATAAPTEAEALRLSLGLDRPGFSLRLDLTLPGRGLTVLFGPSGSGKTTVLRCVAGLDAAAGVVSVGGECWQDSAAGIFKPTWQREIGYVFQEASLFEHLDVRGNLHAGLRRAERRHGTPTLTAAIELLGIGHLLDRPVAGLSGGERQRVAIARALATRPTLLLLDEPLAALDLARRREVLPWLERLHDDLRIPVLYVTHAVDELARLADHVVLLDDGTVTASGPVEALMASPELALALGDEAGIVVPGRVIARDEVHRLAQIGFGGGAVWGRDPGLPTGHALRLRMLARDVSLALSDHADTTIQNRLPGIVEAILPDAHPSQALVRVRCGDTPILARVTWRAVEQLGLASGRAVWCQVKSVALVV